MSASLFQADYVKPHVLEVFLPRNAGLSSVDAADWHVAIFCWNEVERIGACIAAVDRAIGARSGRITVVINGSTDRSGTAAWHALRGINRRADLVELDIADKSEAINHFLKNYGRYSPRELNFFVDGYVLLQPGALDILAAAMRANPSANAASGAAMNGRTEAGRTQEVSHGRMSGALFCLRPAFIHRMLEAGFALPSGLYRGDGLLGSMVCFDLDPVRNTRNPALCLSVPAAGYEIYSLSPFRPSHYGRVFRRKVRQMRGLLENAAIKAIVFEKGYGGLPRDCNAMIRAYVGRNGLPRVGLIDSIFLRLAFRLTKPSRA